MTPLVMSYSAAIAAAPYSALWMPSAFGEATSGASAYRAATTGVARDVPPICMSPGAAPALVRVNTFIPVFGSASADTSVTMRLLHCVSVCQVGFAVMLLHPLPLPDQAVSEARVPDAVSSSEVPPTAVTPRDAAGEPGPNEDHPESPDAATNATVG